MERLADLRSSDASPGNGQTSNASAFVGTNVNSLEPDRRSRRSEHLCERVGLTLAGRDQLAQIPVYQRSPGV